jgi:hypothetical protein
MATFTDILLSVLELKMRGEGTIMQETNFYGVHDCILTIENKMSGVTNPGQYKL